MNMKGVYLHIITDFIGSVIVIFTASISLWLPQLTLLKLYMDPVLSIVMVCLIMTSTVPLGKLFSIIFNAFLVHETTLILLQTSPSNVNLKKIEEEIMQTPGVLAVHEFHVWRLVGARIIATVHIRFLSIDHYMRSAERIHNIFHDHEVHNVTIQPELEKASYKGKFYTYRLDDRTRTWKCGMRVEM
jgi:zinc transporter 1